MCTGGTFRSYDLGVMSPARFLCATPVKTRLQSWSTGGTFRSYDLGVMSPARFLCATPVLHVIKICKLLFFE